MDHRPRGNGSNGTIHTERDPQAPPNTPPRIPSRAPQFLSTPHLFPFIPPPPLPGETPTAEQTRVISFLTSLPSDQGTPDLIATRLTELFQTPTHQVPRDREPRTRRVHRVTRPNTTTTPANDLRLPSGPHSRSNTRQPGGQGANGNGNPQAQIHPFTSHSNHFPASTGLLYYAAPPPFLASPAFPGANANGHGDVFNNSTPLGFGHPFQSASYGGTFPTGGGAVPTGTTTPRISTYSSVGTPQPPSGGFLFGFPSQPPRPDTQTTTYQYQNSIPPPPPSIFNTTPTPPTPPAFSIQFQSQSISYPPAATFNSVGNDPENAPPPNNNDTASSASQGIPNAPSPSRTTEPDNTINITIDITREDLQRFQDFLRTSVEAAQPILNDLQTLVQESDFDFRTFLSDVAQILWRNREPQPQ